MDDLSDGNMTHRAYCEILCMHSCCYYIAKLNKLYYTEIPYGVKLFEGSIFHGFEKSSLI